MSIVASTSRAAYLAVTPSTANLRVAILEIIEAHGADGCIMDDVFSLFPETSRPGGTISSRFSELEGERLIFRNGDTRPGESGKQQKVMRHIKYLPVTATHAPARKEKLNPYVKGFVAATKLVAKSGDLGAAKGLLEVELRRMLEA